MKKIMSALFFGVLFTVVLGVTSCSKEKECVKKEPIEDCICYHLYEPVCGCDGVTYSNDCVAACAGVQTYTEGECN